MFTSLKLFVRQKADIDDIASTLIAFGYRHDKNVYNEGDFSRRGGVVDIFPTNFDSPVRLDFDDDIIRSIVSINPVNGKILWQHKIIIILPQKTKTAETFSSAIQSECSQRKTDCQNLQRPDLCKLTGISPP